MLAERGMTSPGGHMKRRVGTRTGSFVAAMALFAGTLSGTTAHAAASTTAAASCAGEHVGDGSRAALICREATYGVPSVYADRMPGVWFGTGWAQAEDRLVQMELVRRNARGTLSELFGAFDPSTIDQDKQTLTVYYTDAELQQQFDSLPRMRTAITDFVAGVNAYVDHAYATPGVTGQARPVAVLRRSASSRTIAVYRAGAVHRARRRRERELPRPRVRRGRGRRAVEPLVPPVPPGQVRRRRGLRDLQRRALDRRPERARDGSRRPSAVRPGRHVPQPGAPGTQTFAAGRRAPRSAVRRRRRRGRRRAPGTGSCSSRSARAITCPGRTARTRGSSARRRRRTATRSCGVDRRKGSTRRTSTGRSTSTGPDSTSAA